MIPIGDSVVATVTSAYGLDTDPQPTAGHHADFKVPESTVDHSSSTVVTGGDICPGIKAEVCHTEPFLDFLQDDGNIIMTGIKGWVLTGCQHNFTTF